MSAARDLAQLPLGVRLHAGRRFDNFVVGRNRVALAGIEALVDDPAHFPIYLQGAAATGKSHLLQACCGEISNRGGNAAYVPLRERQQWSDEILSRLGELDVVCLDDVDRVAGDETWERAVFRLFNEVETGPARLVVAARQAPSCMSLPDLGSRLQSALRFRLAVADDGLRAEVLRARSAEHGIELPVDALRYILERQPRDLHALTGLVEKLDQFALAAKKKVTIGLVREFVSEQGG